MINIFYGRDSIEKERYIYDVIGKRSCEHIIMVPDQYTLSAEKQAMKYLNTSVLMNLEVISFSRMGHRLMKEVSGDTKTLIDKYGRHMVLTKVLNEIDDLKAFGQMTSKDSFIAMVNDFISEIKQNNLSWEDIAELAEKEESPLLADKLSDLAVILEKYESTIRGEFSDSEDFITDYIGRISKSKALEEKDIWIYGFDSFSPKMLDVIFALEKKVSSKNSLNLVLTYDPLGDNGLFAPIFRLLGKLKEHTKIQLTEIPKDYIINSRAKGISYIEENLFSSKKLEATDEAEGVTLVRSANIYNEVEGAAAFVYDLISRYNYRYRDILIICNDEEKIGSIIRRVFQEYQLPIFSDNTAPIMHNPLILYLMGIFEVGVQSYSTPLIMKTLKLGKSPLLRKEIEQLEDYVIRFKILGNMWTKDFIIGDSYDEIDLDVINNYRQKAIEPFVVMRNLVKNSQKNDATCREFLAGVYNLYANLDIKVDGEEETVFKKFLGLIDQFVEMLGDEKVSGEELLSIFKSTLSQVTVASIPKSVDEIVLGSTQRTRTTNAKAVVVIGANEGLLPKESTGARLFSKDELAKLSGDKDFLTTDKFMRQEEKLGIYRSFSRATEHLRISYSMSDDNGDEMLPSEVFNDINSMFYKEVRVEGELKKASILTEDPISVGETFKVIGGRHATLRHLTEEMVLAKDEKRALDPIWSEVAAWFKKNDPVNFSKIENSIGKLNKRQSLPKELVKQLFRFTEDGKGAMNLHGLETMRQCPFKHFFQYGLRPKERRIFDVDSRATGNLYHIVLEEFCKIIEAGEFDNLQEIIETKDVAPTIDRLVDEAAESYNNGLFKQGRLEEYLLTRVKRLCVYAGIAMIMYYRAALVVESKYEIAFGDSEGCQMPPLIVPIDDGTISIRGIIDKVDRLRDNSLVVIDYKTGNISFDKDKVLSGYSLQLLVYLEAMKTQEESHSGGAFYIRLGENKKNIKNNSVKAEYPVGIDQFALQGVAKESIKSVLDESLVKDHKNSFESDEAFKDMQDTIKGIVEDICKGYANGDISIFPMKIGQETPCTYCNAKDTCNFNVILPGFKYNKVETN